MTVLFEQVHLTEFLEQCPIKANNILTKSTQFGLITLNFMKVAQENQVNFPSLLQITGFAFAGKSMYCFSWKESIRPVGSSISTHAC
jgi:hypothetical protein